MKFSVAERMNLLGVLPVKGDMTTIVIVRNLREDASFSEQEHKDFEIITEGERVSWNADKVTEKEIMVGDKAREIIKKSLKELDKAQELTEGTALLYERFNDNTKKQKG